MFTVEDICIFIPPPFIPGIFIPGVPGVGVGVTFGCISIPGMSVIGVGVGVGVWCCARTPEAETSKKSIDMRWCFMMGLPQ
jgi:hypothetical protein